MVCISMMRMIMRRLICSPICHFYTFTHQFMVEPELFYPEVGSHDLVPQILNSFTMSNIIKEHSLQAQSIIIWKDVKYQYMRSNTLSIPTHPLSTSIKWHRFINSISTSINIDIQRLKLQVSTDHIYELRQLQFELHCHRVRHILDRAHLQRNYVFKLSIFRASLKDG